MNIDPMLKQVYVPLETHRRLKAYRQVTGLSMAQQIRRAVERWLDEAEQALPTPEPPKAA